MLKELCNLYGGSGDEKSVREYIIKQIENHCEYKVDNLGNIIAFKKGRKTPDKKIMFSAHTDEVSFIITDITDDGYLKFSSVGGIDASAVLNRVVCINNSIKGVIGTKAVHQLSAEEKGVALSYDKLYIDIGAKNRQDAENYVQLGDYAYFSANYQELDNGNIISKAIDDRAGCMFLIELIKSDLPYDMYFAFCVQEEVGLRGSKCAAYQIDPDIAIVLEATTAADLCGINGSEKVCCLGKGPVVSFMDLRTVYNRELYKKTMETAKKRNIPVQTKTAVAGGNDAGAIQNSASGAKMLGISLATRYIHGSASMVSSKDINDMRKLINAIINEVL